MQDSDGASPASPARDVVAEAAVEPSAAGGDPDDAEDHNVSLGTDDPFKLFPTLVGLLPPDGHNFTRGDPWYPPSAAAASVIAFLLRLYSEALTWAEAHGVHPTDMSDADLSATFDVTASASSAVAVLESRRMLTLVGDSVIGGIRLLVSTSHHYSADTSGISPLRAVIASGLLNPEIFADAIPPLGRDDVGLTAGANEAIGTILRLFEDGGYLKPGDLVSCNAPIYAPYLSILNEMQLNIVPFESLAGPNTHITTSDIAALRARLAKASKRLKLICLVNPSNPTGLVLRPEVRDALVDLAEEHDAICIEDVVYHEFGRPKSFNSLWAVAPHRTILIYSLSKFMRVPGHRLGVWIITDEASLQLGRLLNESKEALP